MAKHSVKDLPVKRLPRDIHTQTASSGFAIKRGKYLGSMMKNDLGEILKNSLSERKYSPTDGISTVITSKSPVPNSSKSKLSRSKSLSDLTSIKSRGAKSKAKLSVEAMNLENQNNSVFGERVRGGGGIYNLRRLSVSTANLAAIASLAGSPNENVAVRKKNKPFKGSTYSMSIHGSSKKKKPKSKPAHLKAKSDLDQTDDELQESSKKRKRGRPYSSSKTDVDQTDDEFGSIKKKKRGRPYSSSKTDVDQTDDEFGSIRKKKRGRPHSSSKTDVDQTDDEFGTIRKKKRGRPYSNSKTDVDQTDDEFGSIKKKKRGRPYSNSKTDVDQTDDEFGTIRKKKRGRPYSKAKSDLDQTDDEFETRRRIVLKELITNDGELQSPIKDSNREKAMPILSENNNLEMMITADSVEPPALEMQVAKSPIRKRKLSRKESKKLDTDAEYLKLCTCHSPDGNHIASNLTPESFCEGVDCIDDRLIGCVKKTSSTTMLFRPSVRTTFQALCELHHQRMLLHQSCPQCGQFCTQGTFVQCLADPNKTVHLAHKNCLLAVNGVEVCPHCGQSSHLRIVQLELVAPKSTNFFQTQQLPFDNCLESRTDITRKIASKETVIQDDNVLPSKVCKITDTGKEISSVGLPAGPERFRLENAIDHVSTNSSSANVLLSVEDAFIAAKNGDIEKIIQILMFGIDVNVKHHSSDQQTILHIAAGNGHLTLIHILIQAEAAVNAMDINLRTPIMSAIENGHVSVAQYLIKAGVQLDTRGENAETSLHLAAKYGLLEVVKNILDTGKVSVNVQDDGGWTPLIWACEFNHIEIVKLVLDHGADFNLRDKEQNIALHWSALSGSFEISELLLNRGCDVNTRNVFGETPLHVAARQNKYDCVMLFLSRNADVDIANKSRETPIMCCEDQSSQTWLALSLTKRLNIASGSSATQPQIFVSDISRGREPIPIQCVNAIDNEMPPSDYLYVIDNCETFPLTMDRSITSLFSCKCGGDCAGSTSCKCNSLKNRCCWYTKAGRLVEEFDYLEPPMIYECNRACLCFTNCSNRVLQNGIKCRLQMFRTKSKGWGVRTLQDIPKGTFVCEYVGEVISDLEADQRSNDSYLFDLDNKSKETYCIDARLYGNICRFVNHSCDPNLIAIKVFVDYQDSRFPRIAMFSSRSIKAYEELGCDYGCKFWKIKSRSFSCACESNNCKYAEKTIQQTTPSQRRQ